MKAPASVKVKRLFQAPVTQIYRAWTEPAMMNQWFHPNPEMNSVCTVDLGVSGRDEVQMHPKEGDPFIVHGVYEEIIPKKRLTFTWQWRHDEGGEPNEETLVTGMFRAIDAAQTELTLLHERFGSDEERDSHTWGWQETLERLGETRAKSDLARGQE